MAAAVFFPEELRQTFTTSGYRSALPSRRIATKGQTGRPWYRRGPSQDGGRPVQGTMLCNGESELERFWRFYEEELFDGVDPFMLRDQNRDGQVIDDFDDEDGEEMTGTYYWTCLFLETPPPETQVGESWLVQCQLLVIG